ncbi:hypothetical protein JIN85_15180 [Luteolibacter pohnpeiensis]|uniref:Uncharacterized protein n=1 Tax=Luteolibacter pohnpeiensis TaxID=454153 RepID=A0A934VWY4_9BACT|nr:hypothetical protein [Luteolibacter pohnpeiensis]MBK1883760.1 hypothetical protein [Luteolibacter pohnpeiensis]
MPTFQNLIDDQCLEARDTILAMAEIFDQWDAARVNGKITDEQESQLRAIRQAMAYLAFGDNSTPRTEVLLKLLDEA